MTAPERFRLLRELLDESAKTCKPWKPSFTKQLRYWDEGRKERMKFQAAEMKREPGGPVSS